ncbi:MAG TPA: Verru_Chthon cassette protein C [Candidatus Saccharimonadia bacterium]|nr:Verru_Chthon cassette protein C [Candidatus Saccharimonadia bacterium]
MSDRGKFNIHPYLPHATLPPMKLLSDHISKRWRVARSPAFTLVELLLSMVVLSLILIVATSVMSETQRTWLQVSSRTEQFRDARLAFELITQNVRQSTLNTYMTYKYNEGDTPTVPQDKTQAPQEYVRHSELQFVTDKTSAALSNGATGVFPGHCVFFQGTIGVTERDGYEGMDRLLCGRGYFVMHGSDAAYRPPHVAQERIRFRLMEYRPPAEQNDIYSVTPRLWFQDAAKQVVAEEETVTSAAYTRPVTDNIIALIVSPRVSPAEAAETGRKQEWVAPNYAYDSVELTGASGNNPQGTQHLLPPLVRVTLVALDEVSARRLEEQSGAEAPELLTATAFSDAANYERDLKSLEEKLRDEKLNYRIFTTTVGLRNSKWAMYGH